MKHLLLGILLLALLFGCKKKKEEEPYVPVKQTYTDIPGTDIYIANTDSVFVDTGLVITVKGKGFDPKYKGHYTLSRYNFTVYYSQDALPAIPEMIHFDETTIKFKYPADYFPTTDWPQSCIDNKYNFVFVKFSDDPVAELNYQKRSLASSSPKTMTQKGHYTIFKDTVLLTRPRIALSDFFIYYYVDSACDKLSLSIDNRIMSLQGQTNAYRKYAGKPYVVGIPLDSNYNISDGFHTIELLKDGMKLHREGNKVGIYVKNI